MSTPQRIPTPGQPAGGHAVPPSSAQTPQRMPTSQETQTGIRFDLGFLPLGFFLYACRPVININGHAQQFTWGQHFLPLQPGAYDIKISFPYLFIKECGANTVQVNLNPGEVRDVKYYMWPLMFIPGSIKVS